MSSTTFMESVTCPDGHTFKVRRRVANVGKITRTPCKMCPRWFEAHVGPASERAVHEAARSAPTRESDVEARLVKRVKQMGGEVRKVSWVGRKGAPDRLVMLPPAVRRQSLPDGSILVSTTAATIWAEIKAPGKATGFPRTAHERAQHREHERMRKMGQRVEVVDSYEQIEELLK